MIAYSDDSTVVKEEEYLPGGFFEAEAAGLEWLAAAGGARIARVLAVAPGRIELERVQQAAPTQDAARRFGAGLAKTHLAGASAFGAPPDGWEGPVFLGRRGLPLAHETSWGAFYARDRVLPFMASALWEHRVDERQASDIRAACDRIASGEFDDGEPPARIHGDLWSGNVLWGPDGAVLIDPAAHGGHRETDLAMLALFGCPHLDDVLEGYNEVAPLRDGWRARIPMHQLHPLAVRAISFGPAYGAALHDAALAVLAL